jgi:hypothetical protein
MNGKRFVAERPGPATPECGASADTVGFDPNAVREWQRMRVAVYAFFQLCHKRIALPDK